MSIVTPAGHRAGVHMRECATDPSGALERALLDYIESSRSSTRGDYYAPDPALLGGLNVTTGDLHSALMKHENDLTATIGAFVSEAYNLCDESVIIYDLNMEIDDIGAQLRPEKMLVNRGRTGNALGWDSAGLIVNCGYTGDFFGLDAKGTIVNAGRAQMCFGNGSGESIAISLTIPKGYDPSGCTLIRHDEIEYPLRRYLDELAGLCQGPVAGIHNRYGEFPAETIRDDLCKILGVEN